LSAAAKATDQEVGRVNLSAPPGAPRLLSTELQVRGLEAFGRDTPAIMTEERLVDNQQRSASLAAAPPCAIKKSEDIAATLSYSAECCLSRCRHEACRGRMPIPGSRDQSILPG
jgi:hypothetical protein